MPRSQDYAEFKLSGSKTLTPAPSQPLGFGRMDGPFSLRNWLRVLVKWKSTIALCFVAALVLATLVSLRATRLYEATARIAMNREPVTGLHLGPANTEGEPVVGSTVETDTEIQVLASDTLALAVIEALHLQSNSAFTKGVPALERVHGGSSEADRSLAEQAALLRQWHRDLEISKVPRTRMIAVSFRSADAKLSAEVVNTLLHEYSERIFRTRYESTMQATEWLTRQLSELQLKVETSQRALADYQRANGMVELDEKQNITVAKLDSLNRQLSDAEADRIAKQANYELAFSPDREALPALQQDALLQALRQQQAELQRQYAQQSVQLGPAHPKLVEIDQGLKQLQGTIASEIQKVQSRTRGEYQSALSREKLLSAALEKQKLEANDLGTKAIRYFELKREADTYRNLYDDLQRRLKEANVNASLRQAGITIVDPARIPDRPYSPSIPRNLTLGALCGLGFGVLLACVREHLDNTIRTPEQAAGIVELPSLGTVPLSKQLMHTGSPRLSVMQVGSALPASAGSISYLNGNSHFAESFRAIRTSLLLSTPGKSPQAIMVTSALPKEGKSTTTVNIGIALAQKGARVLLVDADLRRPFLHQMLNTTSAKGLSALLTLDTAHACRAAAITDSPNLFLVSAGTCPPNPAELLASDAMNECLARWRSEFDFIVIDTPPVLAVTDAVALSPEMDAVILVLRSGKSTRESLWRSYDRLTQVGARIVGSIVNGVDPGSADARYYGYTQPADYYRSEVRSAHHS